MESFNIVEASIEERRRALESGTTTSVELVVRYLLRIATYDLQGGLNALTLINDRVFDEAKASDDRRRSGQASRPLEGIPYTLKDSYKYDGLTVTNGSPALEGLMSNEDSHISSKLRNS
jgi:Asp-tRNA(Asn)/Glu-tRNA(Gln) amidotransferase A subunit family amidase